MLNVHGAKKEEEYVYQCYFELVLPFTCNTHLGCFLFFLNDRKMDGCMAAEGMVQGMLLTVVKMTCSGLWIADQEGQGSMCFKTKIMTDEI